MMRFDTAKGIQIVERAEGFRAQSSKSGFGLTGVETWALPFQKIVFEGALGCPWGSLGGPWVSTDVPWRIGGVPGRCCFCH